MNDKTNHTVNTLRRGTLKMYHKSASGEKLNSGAEEEIDAKRERQLQGTRHVQHDKNEAVLLDC